MKRLNLSSIVVLTAILMALGTFAVGQEVSSQNVVGFVKIPIVTGWNLLAVPMQKVASYSGTIEDNTGDTITVSGTPWSAGQFAWGATGQEATGSNSYFYVEISDTSSAFEGRHMYITNNTENTITIKGGMPSDIADDDLDTATFKIIAANRVRDIFGDPEPPASIPLAKTDYIYIWDGTTWSAGIYYFGPDGNPAKINTWQMVGGSDSSDLVIDRDEGFFVNYGGAGTNLTIAGEVSQNNQTFVLNSGWNLLGGEYVITETVGSTTLSNQLAKTDYIYPWTGTTWGNGIYYFGPDGNPAKINTWQELNGGEVGSSFEFEVGKAYFFNMTAPSTWVKESPLR